MQRWGILSLMQGEMLAGIAAFAIFTYYHGSTSQQGKLMLKGSLCALRHVVAADLNAFIPLLNDLPSRGAYFGTLFQPPEAIRKEFALTSFVTEEREMFVIEGLDGRLLGSISHFKARSPVCREIGYRIFDQQLTGHGYATEATTLLCGYLFRAYTFNRLELLMDTHNGASERVAQKCGFSYEGTLRGAFFINGNLRDTKLYSLLRPEWEAQQ